jgi:uncharacterized protein (TIGR02588 family)
MKIVGISIWIWVLGFCVVASIGMIALPKIREITKPAALEVVKKELWSKSGRYEVRGQIFNPRKEAARNVLVSFNIWEAKMGQGDKIVKKNRGKATAEFDYVPAGATADFTALSEVGVGKYDTYGIDDGVLVESDQTKDTVK